MTAETMCSWQNHASARARDKSVSSEAAPLSPHLGSKPKHVLITFVCVCVCVCVCACVFQNSKMSLHASIAPEMIQEGNFLHRAKRRSPVVVKKST